MKNLQAVRELERSMAEGLWQSSWGVDGGLSLPGSGWMETVEKRKGRFARSPDCSVIVSPTC